MSYGSLFILLGFVLRLAVACWNGFWGPSFGADLDAAGFHQLAVDYAGNPSVDDISIGLMYSNFLGLIYWLTTTSLFIGSFLSCLVWALSAHILDRITGALCFDSYTKAAVLFFYAFWPSSILYTAVTLREPYQLLFVNLAVYAVFQIYLKKSLLHWLTLLVAVAGMGVLHGGLLAAGGFIIMSTCLLVALRGRRRLPVGRLSLAVLVVAVIAYYGFVFFSSVSYSLDGGLGKAVELYQKGGLGVDGRTNYKDEVAIDGVTGLLLFLPISLFQYLFEPMPWRLGSVVDVPVLLENCLRAWLLWKAWAGLRRGHLSVHHRSVLFVLVVYLTMETVWSLGTINWGTASRHHIPSLGLLLIAAFAVTRTRFRVTLFPRKIGTALMVGEEKA